jgi:hypothetical protein
MPKFLTPERIIIIVLLIFSTLVVISNHYLRAKIAAEKLNSDYCQDSQQLVCFIADNNPIGSRQPDFSLCVVKNKIK